jgi:hypothetical protein
MNSRQYFTTALLQCHKLVVDHFLIVRENPDEQIDIDTADQLAEDASLLAVRLTVQWQAAMRLTQLNDDNLESHRESSTADLFQPFEVSPDDICPNCGGDLDNDDCDDDGADAAPMPTPLPDALKFKAFHPGR